MFIIHHYVQKLHFYSFLAELKNTKQENLADVIHRAGPLWTKCWGDAASPRMAVGAVEMLVTTLAMVPFSQEAKVPPPPCHALKSAMKRYLTSNIEPLLAAETSLNVVRKLLSFEWNEERTVVKDALGTILEDAAGLLQRRNQDHRDCINRIDACLDKLEKPWIIKEKHQGPSVAVGDNGSDIVSSNQSSVGNLPHHHYSNWRHASIEWLVHGPTFSPTELPKMQGPNTKSRGVYRNKEHYFDTMQRLMIAMAFHEGHAALAPKCWERGGGGQACGGTLVQLPETGEADTMKNDNGNRKSQSSGPLRCRGRGCPNSPVFVCKVSSHSRGLCKRCAHNELQQLLGT